MSIAWGNFEDMAVHYLRELSKKDDDSLVIFCNTVEQVYGVSTGVEFMGLLEIDKTGGLRPVCSATADEFMGLLFARFLDFAKEEDDAAKKKDLSTGELFGSESPTVDAGGDQGKKGGRGEDMGGRQEEDNHRKSH